MQNKSLRKSTLACVNSPTSRANNRRFVSCNPRLSRTQNRTGAFFGRLPRVLPIPAIRRLPMRLQLTIWPLCATNERGEIAAAP